MAKKLHTDGNLLHHDHQHPFQPNAHPHEQRDSTHPSISSANQQNRNVTGKFDFPKINKRLSISFRFI
jgi:hypothetical protein